MLCLIQARRCNTIIFNEKEIDGFLTAKGYARTTIKPILRCMRMLDKMDIRTKEAVWDRFRNYSSGYHRMFYRAIVLMNEFYSLKATGKGGLI